MKTNRDLPNLKAFFCFLTFISFILSASAQPDYVFKNGTLVSGTDLAVGAKYRYKNIKPGVDGIITIANMFNVSLDEIDGASGFDEAFQPYIYCPGRKKGYVEFTLDFVTHNTNTPQVMLEAPMTAIDIDGWEFPDEKITEYDQFKLTPSYHVNYSTVGSQLNVMYTGGPTGWVSAENRTGVVYDGIDTTQRDVMFTIVYANVSSVTFRVGADNKSRESMQRLRSVYFKKFSYPNGLLASNTLLHFGGNAANNTVDLRFALIDPSKIKTVTVERAAADMNFKAINEVAVADLTAQYQVKDIQAAGVSYYRLKILDHSGGFIYSNVLRFDYKAENKEVFKMYPSVIEERATVMLEAASNESATVQIVDYNGRIVYRRQITVQKGINSISIDGLSTLGRGNYIATVQQGNQLLQQKIVKY